MEEERIREGKRSKEIARDERRKTLASQEKQRRGLQRARPVASVEHAGARAAAASRHCEPHSPAALALLLALPPELYSRIFIENGFGYFSKGSDKKNKY